MSPIFLPIGFPFGSKITWSGSLTPIWFPFSSYNGSGIGGKNFALNESCAPSRPIFSPVTSSIPAVFSTTVAPSKSPMVSTNCSCISNKSSAETSPASYAFCTAAASAIRSAATSSTAVNSASDCKDSEAFKTSSIGTGNSISGSNTDSSWNLSLVISRAASISPAAAIASTPSGPANAATCKIAKSFVAWSDSKATSDAASKTSSPTISAPASETM